MEYPALVAGHEVEFAAHMTDMSSFKPITEGTLACIFTLDNAPAITVSVDAPARPGFFRPKATFTQAGTYSLDLILHTTQVSDTVHIGEIVVYPDAASVPHSEKTASGEEVISFLKEQQWKIDFRTEPARTHTLYKSIKAVGEIQPAPNSHADIVTPVDGIMSGAAGGRFPVKGAAVRRGEVLGVITPLASTKMEIALIHATYRKAESEWQRVQSLTAENAVSRKRIDDARTEYEAAKTVYNVLDWDMSEESGTTQYRYVVRSPLDGVLENAHVRIGQAIHQGEALFTVVNPRRLHLIAKVPLIYLQSIEQTHDASFTVEGNSGMFELRDINGRIVTIGGTVDRDSRTVPVVFEMDNPGNRLKIGMFAYISVRTDVAVNVLAVPAHAVYNEYKHQVVFIHTAGESFSKRIVTTGIADGGYVQILHGVNEGERVVTAGGYQVKLASLSTVIPTGHGHAH
ncbi:MAG: efflux RND transporter periplasmic adaptor subunit [Candidatus Latescibacter sp.]|nr:efflux RND transporter periplasmic adaptor subunit [Candidatus Latescibacter sp.]